jgi:UPF0176 protein
LDDPEAVRLWQKHLCESLGLKGRILLSPHGINGTLGGGLSALKKYVKKTRAYPGFKLVDFKWSEGTGSDFPRLRIRVREEIVTFGVPGELKVDQHGVIGGGVRLSPREVNQLVAQRGDDVVFFDARNAFEAKIGKFKNAVVPEVRATRDLVGELENGKFDHLKDRPVVTYCTGGLRCEVLSSVMKNRGFSDVYQSEEFADEGLWEGSLYLFDRRMNHQFSDRAKTLGRCERCDSPTSTFYNCANLACRKLILLCASCKVDNLSTNCSPQHQRL